MLLSDYHRMPKDGTFVLAVMKSFWGEAPDENK